MQAMGIDPLDSRRWTFGTGSDAAIHPLADAVGFQYTYDESSKQFAHAAVVFVLTPDGRSRATSTASTFRRATSAWRWSRPASGKVGTSLDKVLLSCYQYDPATRRYEPFVLGFMRIGAALVFLALAGLLTVLWRKELAMRKQAPRRASA